MDFYKGPFRGDKPALRVFIVRSFSMRGFLHRLGLGFVKSGLGNDAMAFARVWVSRVFPA